MRVALALLLLAGCGPALHDCPPEAWQGVEDAIPSAVLDRMDVHCEDVPYRDDVPCVTWWYGSSMARGKASVFYRLATPCIVHESQHWFLFDVTGDGCASHLPECGWTDTP